MSAQHATFSEREAAMILRSAGVSDHDAQALTQEHVIQEEPSLDDLMPAVQEGGNVDQIVQSILKHAHGDKAAALRACDQHVRAEFDRIKLSKIEAAKAGLDAAGKSEHNRNAWSHCQEVGESLKAQVRAAFRENGGFVASKITRGKHVRTAELDAFLAQHGHNEQVHEMARLLGL